MNTTTTTKTTTKKPAPVAAKKRAPVAAKKRAPVAAKKPAPAPAVDIPAVPQPAPVAAIPTIEQHRANLTDWVAAQFPRDQYPTVIVITSGRWTSVRGIGSPRVIKLTETRNGAIRVNVMKNDAHNMARIPADWKSPGNRKSDHMFTGPITRQSAVEWIRAGAPAPVANGDAS